MPTHVKPVPDGQSALTPYLTVSNGAKAIEFYQKAFGAVEEMRMAAPDGKIGHAELKIGTARFMLSDEYPEMGVRSPESIGGSPVALHLYVEDVDATFAQAVAAGAKVVRPVEDQFYGDRAGKLVDPFGHSWFLATHKEDVAPEELKRRAEKLFGQG
jgi:PhnB protein